MYSTPMKWQTNAACFYPRTPYNDGPILPQHMNSRPSSNESSASSGPVGPRGAPPMPMGPTPGFPTSSGQRAPLPPGLRRPLPPQKLTREGEFVPATANPNQQINHLLNQTASLMAANAQLRREITQARASGAMMADGGFAAHDLFADYAAATQMSYFQRPRPLLLDYLPREATAAQASQAAADLLFGASAAVAHTMSSSSPPPPAQTPAATPLQQQNGHPSSAQRSSGKRSPKPQMTPSSRTESYKTVMCQAWLESRTCAFGENCRFAHGEEELRPVKIQPRENNKYKTKLCDKYTTTGLCPYGNRCLFIHPDNGNAYIRPDKIMEVTQRHAMAEVRAKQMQQAQEQHILLEKQLLSRPETPTAAAATSRLPGFFANAGIPIGATPQRGAGSGSSLLSRVAAAQAQQAASRPHPSWPLEPAAFFQEKSSDDELPPTSAASFFESLAQTPLLPTAAAVAANVPRTAGGSPFEMNDEKGHLSGDESTPGGVSGYGSGGSTPLGLEISPFSTTSSSSSLNLVDAVSDDKEFDLFDFGGIRLDQMVHDMTKNLGL